MKKLIIVCLLFSTVLFAQVCSTVRGKIVDSKTNEPLIGVNVVLLETIRGASTNADGEYFVEHVPPGQYVVRISRIGHKTTDVDIVVQFGKPTTLNVELEETAIEIDPIVVLGGKTQQRLDEASVSISVVTSKEIEFRNPTNLVEALETMPGVNFIGEQINIRGSTGFTFGAGNKTLLLLDGVPVYASDTGAFNWDMLPPLDIEQVEVLKGAGSTLWGASALGGVVNITTKDPSDEGKLLFSYTLGKHGAPPFKEWEWTDHSQLYYNRQDVSYSKRFGGLGMRLSAGRFVSDGYSQLGDFEKYNLTGKLDYRFKNGIKWTGYTAFSQIDRGFFIQWKGQNDPYEVDDANLDNRAQVNQINFYTKLAVPISARFGLNFRASVVRSLMGNQFGSGTDFNPAYGQGLEIQGDYIPVWGHTITFGTQFQLDSGSTKYFDTHKGYFIGPYIQDEWKALDNLRLTLGLRYDRYKLFDGKREDLFSPRFGINWQPWEKTSIRGSVGSGFRAATIVERFLEMNVMNFKIKANPELKAESSWAYDVGFRQYFTDNWNIDVSFFLNDYWELIEAHLDLIRGQIQFRNIPRARIQGIEATSKASWDLYMFGQNVTPGVQVSVTAMDHENMKYHEPLTYRPKVIGNIRTSLRINQFDIQADYRYASKIEQVKIYPINDRVPMNFFDARCSYHYKALKIQLGVNNLLNYAYAPMESNLMPPRTFTLGLKGEF